ncbi:MAG TPA: sugar ABC transporter permease [Thermomicrobiales bacterium]|nr:sugar ABC transporter permease [Thermomicrobiales bacterium]
MALAQTTKATEQGDLQIARGRRSLLQRDGVLAWLFMIPGWTVLVLFMGYPFFLGIWLSLTDKMLGFSQYDYIGLQNYRDLWADSIFQQTLRNTAYYGVGTVPFKLLFGLGLALLLNRQFRFSRFFRAGLLLPWIVPTALSSLAWLMLFSSVLSPISLVLRQWGLIDQNINFLGDAWNARISLCIANIWRGVPFFAISILAGLQAVPTELVEAAALDGASRWDRFRAVIFPVIKPIVLITTLFSIIWTISDFQLVYVLTKGGPANETHVLGTYAYQIGMNATQIGQAAAISLYMFPALALGAILLLRSVRGGDTQ